MKPAYEPIIIARKPFKGSLINNIINNGVGGLNIDECRIGEGTGEMKKVKYPDIRGDNYNQGHHAYENTIEYEIEDKGRFPANIIHDGLEEEWSRYFYTSKASKKDRDEGLEEFEDKILDIGDERPSGGSWERRTGKKPLPRKNIHPTVKPTELMQYLVRLVAPKGTTILDPFMGSGSTGKAVMYENKERNKNYKFIGIENSEEYLPISEARIKYADIQSKIENEQQTIFDYM